MSTKWGVFDVSHEGKRVIHVAPCKDGIVYAGHTLRPDCPCGPERTDDYTPCYIHDSIQ